MPKGRLEAWNLMKNSKIYFLIIFLNCGCIYQQFGSLKVKDMHFKAYLSKSPPFEFSITKKKDGTNERWTISGAASECRITKFYYELNGKMYYGVDSISKGSYFFNGDPVVVNDKESNLIPIDTMDLQSVVFLLSQSNYSCSKNSIHAASKVIGYIYSAR